MNTQLSARVMDKLACATSSVVLFQFKFNLGWWHGQKYVLMGYEKYPCFLAGCQEALGNGRRPFHMCRGRACVSCLLVIHVVLYSNHSEEKSV